MINFPFSFLDIRLTTIIISLTTILSCSSNPPKKMHAKPDFSESFATEITADGTKLFTYRIEISRPHGSERPPKQKRKGGKPDRSRDQPGVSGQKKRSLQNLEKRLDSGLNSKLEQSQFCLKGHLVLDRYIGNATALIRGECREGANDSESTDTLSQHN